MKIRSAASTSSPTSTCVGPTKRAVPLKTVQPCSVLAATLDAAARWLRRWHPCAPSRPSCPPRRRRSIATPIVRRAARDVRRVGARDHRLGRRAAGVDAGAAEALRSTIATFMPAPASRLASGGPACPVPITSASYPAMPPSVSCQPRSHSPDAGNRPLRTSPDRGNNGRLERATRSRPQWARAAPAPRATVSSHSLEPSP